MKAAQLAGLLLVFPVVCAACTANKATSVEPQALEASCVPNQTLVCLCGLDEGVQSCTPERTLTACVCPPARRSPSVTTFAADASVPTEDGGAGSSALCGNGKIDPGEACDDGNVADGDGCSSRCTPDGAPLSASTCPGQALRLWAGASVALAGTTEGSSNRTSASCYDARGPERVYAITPMRDGVLTIDASFSPGFDAVLSVRDGECATSSSEILCEDTLSQPVRRVVTVRRERPYFVIVDGDATTAQGAFAVRLELL